MTPVSFAKLLSANDVGTTGSHQAGIHVPKSNRDLLSFFPPLDPMQLNPDTWFTAVDDAGRSWKLRYIYYNSRLHSCGTRDEYRITHLRDFLGKVAARQGDLLVFSRDFASGGYSMSIQPAMPLSGDAAVIQLRGWRRVH